VCLRAYSKGAQQARYLVTVDWNGMPSGRFQRLDIGAEDDAGDTWPQLRDGRLQPRPRATDEYIVVSDVSRYPLQFMLLGFTRAAADAFDQSCRDGFCSLRLPADGVTELTSEDGASIGSVAAAPHCP
jgi:hypothetical protein